ncbi:hypothetical protein STXM2123_2668 [Streptomyces sp. F-3]|nr:hypothetical protein STXM2123_2668 [Streptomyces sp. F-3]
MLPPAPDLSEDRVTSCRRVTTALLLVLCSMLIPRPPS